MDKLKKLLIPAILLFITFQVWMAREIQRLDRNDHTRGNEVRMHRERIRSIDAQFQEIIWDVAYRKAMDMIKKDIYYK